MKIRHLLALTCALPFSLHTHAELSEEFLYSAPKVQLYMTYAEFKMGHYEQAKEMWDSIGGKGIGEANFNLGILYEQGLGVEKNLTTARDKYLTAARHGSRAGAYQVGLMHSHSPDLVDEATARQWLTVAAIDGDEDAQALLAKMDGKEQAETPMGRVRSAISKGNIEQAIQQLEQLTANDHPPAAALTQLGWLYESGLGVERDIDKAAQLFEQAASAGDAKAQYAIAIMYRTGVGREQDENQATKWLKAAAAQDYAPAIAQLQQ